jgi:hypothetical protein
MQAVEFCFEKLSWLFSSKSEYVHKIISWRIQFSDRDVKPARICKEIRMLPAVPRRWLPQGVVCNVSDTLKELHKS